MVHLLQLCCFQELAEKVASLVPGLNETPVVVMPESRNCACSLLIYNMIMKQLYQQMKLNLHSFLQVNNTEQQHFMHHTLIITL